MARQSVKGRANADSDRLDRVTVPGAARALRVFEIYARERRGMTKSEISRLMGLPESSTSDLLNTLRDLGYISRTVTSRQFYPTSRLNELLVRMPANGLAAFAAEATSLVATETGETAAFAVIAGNRAEIVAASQGHHRLRYVVTAGETVSLYATSVGKAVLSGIPAEDREHLLSSIELEALTPQTNCTIEAIEADLAEGLERGTQIVVDEGSLGVSSIAVPGLVGELPVGLSIIGPSDRFATHRDELTAGLLRVHANIFDR